MEPLGLGRGPELEGCEGWNCCLAHPIHTYSPSTPAYPFLPREGAPGVRWGRSSQGAEKEASPHPHPQPRSFLSPQQAEQRQQKVKAGSVS